MIMVMGLWWGGDGNGDYGGVSSNDAVLNTHYRPHRTAKLLSYSADKQTTAQRGSLDLPRLSVRAGFYPRWLGSCHLISISR